MSSFLRSDRIFADAPSMCHTGGSCVHVLLYGVCVCVLGSFSTYAFTHRHDNKRVATAEPHTTPGASEQSNTTQQLIYSIQMDTYIHTHAHKHANSHIDLHTGQATNITDEQARFSVREVHASMSVSQLHLDRCSYLHTARCVQQHTSTER